MSKWISLNQNDNGELETFLREQEYFSVAPIARIRKGLHRRDKIWKLCGNSGRIEAVLLYSGRTLFPVFNGNDPVPVPLFMRFFLMKYPIYAMQGLGRDVQQLEKMLEARGILPSDPKDFFLMKLDTSPIVSPDGDRDLIIRKPGLADVNSLYELHKQYEIEEVIPKGSSFNPVNCMFTVNSMMTSDQVLVGEINGRLVAKVNVNGESYSRYQIGGVFVDPEFRGKGYATQLVAEFCRRLISEGKGVNLFAKKINAPAVKVYKKLGFQVISDYRITYF